MANMIPDIPVDGAPVAEQQVYTWLRDGLPDDYTVFHSVPMLYRTTDRGIRPGEMDFVVTHPRHGLLVLEVKGGAEVGCTADRGWYSVRHDTGARVSIKKDPFEQAQTNLFKLTKKIVDAGVVRRRGDLPFPFGHACWFPGADRIDGPLPPNATPEVILTRSDHTRTQAAIEQAFGAYRGADSVDRSSAEPVLQAIRERVLQPEFRVVRSLRTQIRDADEMFSRMTEQQADLFNGMLRSNRRALVKGYAGTGKTFLAAHRAAELGRAGKSTLLLCFNRHLADHLEQKMAEVPNTNVATFHQLADELDVHVPGQSFPSHPDQEFWEFGAADLLMDAVAYGGIQYDAILVDEAQDFREAWWSPVFEMLHEDSHFYVFLDPGQNIFQTSLDGLVELPTTVPLTKNCRSTEHISRFAAQVARRDEDVSPEHVGEGVEVRRHAFADRDEQIDLLAGIVRTLKQEEKLSSSDIVLLSARSYERCLLADEDYRLAGYDVAPFALDEPTESTLYYESIYGFKGMEAPVVVLFDVLDGHVTGSDATVYVGSTRARQVLHVVHQEGWTPGGTHVEDGSEAPGPADG